MKIKHNKTTYYMEKIVCVCGRTQWNMHINRVTRHLRMFFSKKKHISRAWMQNPWRLFGVAQRLI